VAGLGLPVELFRSASMGTVHPFIRVRSFDPNTLQILGVALDTAWYQLMVSGSALAASWRAEHTREALASRIIASALMGERDVDRLCKDALAHVESLIVEPTAPPLAPLSRSVQA
jgi:hypothetical protein